MARIRVLFLFYRSFFLKPGLLLTTLGSYLYYKNAKYGFSIGPAVFILKAVVFAATAYIVYSRKELYYYYNLRLSYFVLVLAALIIDFLLFFSCLKLIKYRYSQNRQCYGNRVVISGVYLKLEGGYVHTLTGRNGHG